jgi:hypothetical protein
LCYFRDRISKIWKNRLSGAGQVLGIPDKQSSTVYLPSVILAEDTNMPHHWQNGAILPTDCIANAL